MERPNQVWCADITYLPMRRGFLYLVAIMDWFTRKVLAWRISNTLEADFCIEALNEAIHRFGPPEIMNTDQGSQFTGFAWTDRLRRVGTRISMDGKGRCLDNIFIERLWRSLKYECEYLQLWETGTRPRPASVGGLPSTITSGLTPPICDRPPWSLKPDETDREQSSLNPPKTVQGSGSSSGGRADCTRTSAATRRRAPPSDECRRRNRPPLRPGVEITVAELYREDFRRFGYTPTLAGV